MNWSHSRDCECIDFQAFGTVGVYGFVVVVSFFDYFIIGQVVSMKKEQQQQQIIAPSP